MDDDLWPGLIPLWLASVAILVASVRSAEPLDGRATIAGFIVVALPYAVARSRIKKV